MSFQTNDFFLCNLYRCLFGDKTFYICAIYFLIIVTSSNVNYTGP